MSKKQPAADAKAEAAEPAVVYAPVTNVAQAQALPALGEGVEAVEVDATENTIAFFKDADGTNMRVVGLEDGSLAKTAAPAKKAAKKES